MNPTPPSVRLVHVSDIHLTVPRVSWRSEDWRNKRLAAWLNLRILGRGYRFRHAEAVLSALAADLRVRPEAYLVFSGDATAMGFGEEMERAAELLGVGRRPGLAVPGNHDYCTRTAQREGHFERHFGPWLAGERIDEEPYPFAQRVGGAWLVAVNSATANVWPCDASGRVGRAQLGRLRRLLARLEDGPRILVTHYPVARPSGWGEPPMRKLRDLPGLLRVAAEGGVGLWLHGHIHKAYHFPPGRLAPFPIICAGSATQTGLWSYGEYTLTRLTLAARLREYDPATGTFRDGTAFEVEMPG